MNKYMKIGIGAAVGIGAGYLISKKMPNALGGIVGAHAISTMAILGVIGGYVSYKMIK